MLKKLKDLLSITPELQSEEDKTNQLQQACAVLLLEVSRADDEKHASELGRIKDILQQQFNLTTAQLDELIALGEAQGKQATAMYPFTKLINEHYEYEQRVELLSWLWEIAYADGELDPYEDHLIRKLADLLYVGHSDFIKTKLGVSDK